MSDTDVIERIRVRYRDVVNRRPEDEGLFAAIAARIVVAPDGHKFKVTPPLDYPATDEEIISRAREKFGRKRINWRPFVLGFPTLFLIGFAPAWGIYFIGRYVARGFLSS